MKRKIITTFLASAVMLSCAACSTSTETSEETTTAAEETTVATTAEESSSETTSEETSSENGSSVMSYAEFDGTTLQDGNYYLAVDAFDDDLNGGIFTVYSYGTMSEEAVNALKVGDTILWDSGTKAKVENIETTDFGIWISDYFMLDKQEDGTYHLCDDCGGRDMRMLAEDFHIAFASDMVIWDNVDPYAEGDNKFFESSYQYKDMSEFIADINEKAFVTPGLGVVVKDGEVTEMYINPELHEPWK